MSKFPLSAIAACAALIAASTASAGVIQMFNDTTGSMETEGPFIAGQSVTTPASGPWNQIRFTFLGVDGATPHAAGTLYLLSEAFTGTPAQLDNSAPGFLALTSTISADRWVFNPAVTLLANTQYFFFADSPVTLSGNTNMYPGGSFYSSYPEGTAWHAVPGDSYFILSGSPVPEPGYFVVVLTSLACLCRRSRSL